MSEILTVNGTIEMDGVMIYVRFDDDSPAHLLNLSRREHLERFKVPGSQTTGGESGSFTVRIEGHKVLVVGTHLDGRQPWSESALSSPASSGKSGQREKPREAASRAAPRAPVTSEPRQPASAPSSSAPEAAPADIKDRFIHPYNFVRLPSKEALEPALAKPLFQRSPSATHDQYEPKLNTGYLECELTTRTDWFIPDPRKVSPGRKHKTLGYFTLDPVSAGSWRANDPAADATKPAIPGSSIRGMVRSIFESVTLSCYSVFDHQPLDFRIGYSPDYKGENAKRINRGAAEYVPCRVTKCSRDGTLCIQRLSGKFESDPPAHSVVIPVVLVNCYSPAVWYEEPPWSKNFRAGSQQPDALIPTGTPVLVICDKNVQPKRKRQKDGNFKTLFRFRQSTKPLLALDTPDALDLSQISYDPNVEMLVFGYFHRTGPNIENKHHERVLFRGDASYNKASDQQLEVAELHQRVNAFLHDEEGLLRVRQDVGANTMTMLRGYADRLSKNIAMPAPRNLSADPQPPYPSDFVMKRESDVEINEGDLFYALIEHVPDKFRDGESDGKHVTQPVTVRGLYPVAVPRLSHEESRGNLLADDLYPCGRRHEKCPRCVDLSMLSEDQRKLCDDCKDSWQNLCPACRVFGWTRDMTHFRREDRKRLSGQADRVDALAGHVRFSHATLLGDWGSAPCRCAQKIRLKILSSPHPTTTGFYLQFLHPAGAERTAARDSRWPPVTALDNERNPVAKLPAYRRSEARLSGRKMYRGRQRTTVNELEHDKETEQNQTVHALPADLTFQFRVYFDNLTDEELAALIFALNLDVPDAWKQQHPAIPEGAEFCHAIGHGKPLGMGRCSIAVGKICIEGSERYAPSGFGGVMDASSQRDLVAEDIQPFFDAWGELESNAELVRMRSQLLEMLLTLPGTEPVHYPPAAKPDGTADFTWWKNAKTQGITLPDPIDERTDASKRLPETL